MKFTLISTLTIISFALRAEVSLNFSEYWKKVKESNPTIKEQEAQIKSVENNPSLEIPAPEVSISQMNDKVPFSSSGKMQRTIEMSQGIPFLSKFSKATEIKKTNISKSAEESLLLGKKIKREAYEVFLTYAKNLELKKILSEKLKFYQDHLARAKSLQVTSQAFQVHLYDIGIEISSIKSEEKLKGIEINENKSMLNQLRNHAPSDSISEIDLPTLSPPEIYSKKEEILKNHPALKLNQLEVESMIKEKEMAKLDWAPDFNLKLRSIKSFDPHFTDGKEIMIGMTLPFIFPWQRSNKVESLAYKINAQEFKGQKLKNQLDQEYTVLENKITEQWDLLTIYRNQTLPLVQKKLSLAHKLTATDMESLDAHKNAIDQLINLKIKILEEEMNYRLSNFILKELLDSNEG